MMALSRTVSGKVLESGFADHPDHKINIEPAKGAVTVTVDGRVLVKTEKAVVLHEANYAPVYYFPRSEIDPTALKRSDHTTWCPYKGAAGYFSVVAEDGGVIENAIWFYEDPFEETAAIKGYLGFMPSHAEIAVSEV